MLTKHGSSVVWRRIPWTCLFIAVLNLVNASHAQTVVAWGFDASRTNVPPAATNVVAISAGSSHTLALRKDESVVAWGSGSQTNVPAAATNVIQVSVGYDYNLVLRSDGSILGWGNTVFGKTTPPASATNVVAIAAGTDNSLALRSDGTVVAWGSGNNGSTNPPASVVNVRRIATSRGATAGHHLVLRRDGTLVAWGNSANGRTNIPAEATNVIAIAVGADHNLALRANGTVVAWGANSSGQNNVPSAATNVVAVAAGNLYSLALRADGTIVGWGNTTYGKTTAPAHATNALSIAASTFHSVALVGDGKPQFVDSNQDLIAYVGRDFTLNASAVGAAPLNYQWQFNGEDIPGATGATLTRTNVQYIDSGVYSVAVSNTLGAITGLVATVSVEIAQEPPTFQQHPQSQTVYAGTAFELTAAVTGNPQPSLQWQFDNVNIPGATNATFSIDYTMLTNAGNYRVIASSYLGAVTSQVATLTVNMPFSPVFTNWPSERVISAGSPLVLSVSASGEESLSYQWYLNDTKMEGVGGPNLTYTAVRLEEGGVYRVVASNEFGTNSSPEFRLIVVPVAAWGNGSVTNLPSALTNAIAISAGASHALALKADGTVIAWGSNDYGQLNIPANLSNVVAISASPYNNLVLKADGTLVGWGTNISAQLNIPANATNIISIAAGNQFSLALKADGSVLAWGKNDFGQLNIPSSATNVVALAAGSSHSVALRTDGTLVTWGLNNSGVLSIPTGATNIVAIAAGTSYSSALRKDGVLISWGSYPPYRDTFFSLPSNLENVSAMAAGGPEGVALQSNRLVNRNTFPSGGAPPSWITNVVAVSQGSGFRLALIRPVGGVPLPQVATRRAFIDGRAMFSGHSAGQRVAKYQWKFNGSSLPGATNHFLAISPAQAFHSGDYSVVVTDHAGSIASFPSQLEVVAPPLPEIIQQPSSMIVGAGSNATFTAIIASGIPAALQWFFNGSQITGATSSVLALTNIQSFQAGDYQLLAVNTSGSITSQVATLVVTSTPPQIISQPVSRTAALSQTAVFTSTARGTEPLYYQWQFNETNIEGATNANLTLGPVMETSVGVYRVMVSNAAGSVASADASLSIVPTVGWGVNSAGQLDVPPAATNLISMAAGLNHMLALKDDGTVVAWGTNSCGQASVPASASNVVRIAAGHVHSVALQSDGTIVGWGDARFAKPPEGLSNIVEIASGSAHNIALKEDGTVAAWGLSFSGSTAVPLELSNVVAIAAGAFHNIALRSDGTAVTWGSIHFVPANATNLVAVTAGQGYCAALRADGTIVAWGALAPPTGVSDSLGCGGHSFSISGGVDRTLPVQIPSAATNIVAIAGGRHHLVAMRGDGQLIAWGDNSFGQLNVPSVSNGLGLIAGGHQTFVFDGSLEPRTAKFQTNRFAGEDSPVMLSSTSLGFRPLSFQWSRNGVPLSEATNEFLFLPRVFNEDSGDYELVVSNVFGSFTNTVSLSVTAAAPKIVSNPVSTIVQTGSNVLLAVSAFGSKPLQYQWLLNGVALVDGGNISGSTNSMLQIDNAIPANSGSYSVIVSNLVGSVVSSNAPLFVFDSPLGDAVDTVGQLWTTGGAWIWQTNTTKDGVDAAQTGPHTGAHTNWMETTVSGPTAIRFWWKSSGWVTDRFRLEIDGVEQFAITHNTDWQQRSIYIPGGEHTVRWVFTGNNTINFSTAWLDQLEFIAPVAPSIISQPTSRTASEGTDVTFTVTAQGTETLSYLWQFEGVDIPGATRSSLTLSNVSMTAAGPYRVRVSNVAGSPLSQEAILTITGSGPVLKTAPQPKTAAPGTTLRIDSAFTGSGPIAYRWQHYGTEIQGATSNILTISNVQQEHSGLYRVIASNPFGSTISAQVPFTLVPVATWGSNRYGESDVPADVGTVIGVAAGTDHSMALRPDGSTVYWGYQPSLIGNTPKPLIENFIEVVSRGSHHVGLRGDGSVAAWGLNAGGLSSPPVSASNIIAIAAGVWHNLAVRSDGQVITWGSSANGLSNVPVHATNCVAVAAGAFDFSMALREDGTVIAWGTNSYGQLDIPATLTNAVAISAGGQHALALRADGTIEAWGRNDYGQATVPAGLSNVVAISAGTYHNLALRTDGKVVSWGLSTDGRTAVSPTLQDVIAISAGESHSLALVGNGVPTITVHPAAHRQLSGSGVRLHVFATGSGPLSYQWQRDGMNLEGATNAWLDVQTSGVYQVIVFNAIGATISKSSTVSGSITPIVPGFEHPHVIDSPSGPLFRMTLTGLTGQGVVILYGSTDLILWEPIFTNSPAVGSLLIEHTLSEENPFFFYRALEQR